MKNIKFNIELTQQEIDLISNKLSTIITENENLLIEKVKKLGYDKYEVEHNIRICSIDEDKIYFKNNFLTSTIKFDRDLEIIESSYNTHDIRFVDNSYTKERNAIGYEIRAIREQIKNKIEQEETEKKALKEAEEKAEEDKKNKIQIEIKNWIEENGSECLKNLYEFSLDYRNELFKQYVEKANIPNFYKIGEIDSYTERPPCEVVTVGKKLKDLGFEIIGFSTNSVEVKYNVFGIEKYILCRP